MNVRRLAVLLAVLGAGCPDDRPPLEVSWTVLLDGAPATCDEVGGHGVELSGTDLATGERNPYSFGWQCLDASKRVDQPVGDTRLELRLLAARPDPASRSTLLAVDEELVDFTGREREPVSFQLDVEGPATPPATTPPEPDPTVPDTAAPAEDVLELTVDFGGEGGANCVGVLGGDPLVEERLHLVADGSTDCVAVPVEGTGGDTCGAPIGCLEPEDVQRIAVPAPGAYTLTIEGYVTGDPDPVRCYAASFRVDVTGTTGLAAVVPELERPECDRAIP